MTVPKRSSSISVKLFLTLEELHKAKAGAMAWSSSFVLLLLLATTVTVVTERAQKNLSKN